MIEQCFNFLNTLPGVMNLSVASEYTYIEKCCLYVLVIKIAHCILKVKYHVRTDQLCEQSYAYIFKVLAKWIENKVLLMARYIPIIIVAFTNYKVTNYKVTKHKTHLIIVVYHVSDKTEIRQNKSAFSWQYPKYWWNSHFFRFIT